MKRKFYDDIFLYKTIKEVTQLENEEAIEHIYDIISNQHSWKISDIEEEAEKWN